jgi:hypothetical protein
MSCSDKHVIAWKSFEIGDGILYTEGSDVTISFPMVYPHLHFLGFFLDIIPSSFDGKMNDS